MTLGGEIADFCLGDIIQLIGRTRKTGKLVVSGRKNYLTLYFKEGRAVFASPAHQRDYLGNLLIRRGVVSRADVEEALEVQRKLRERGVNLRIGSVLAARGAISRQTLQRYVQIQIEETVVAALSETHGHFEFIPDAELDDQDILVAVDAEWVILESSRQIDEWTQVGKNAPSPDAVFIINPDPETTATTKLEMDDWRLVSLVNGARTVTEIVERAGMSRVKALQTLSRLVELNVLVEERAGSRRDNHWSLVPDMYRPPPPPAKGILGRIIDRIRRL
ncbi:MAG: DUF4388 domain-containing protein [Candidatus Coatesbacteria bacterium]|nr:MAG: DUF4388 domain-containing protein [Candidatus Coatesbacteria bacterium]